MPIVNRVADLQPDIQAWRQDIHQHPELLYDVHRTAAFVAERLREFGCDEVATGLGRTGVVGVIKGRKPAGKGDTKVIGLRADMDALPIEEATNLAYASRTPGKMHACLVRVLKTIGYDVGFQKGQGQYLFDRDGVRYLDLLSGYGVFAIGRNHPALREALKSVLDSELPNLVQMDVSTLAGILAERLLAHVPYLDKVFFANSGSEAVEAGIKFARAATGRPGIVYCEHAFHGLTNGALSLNGDEIFREGFGPLLP